MRQACPPGERGVCSRCRGRRAAPCLTPLPHSPASALTPALAAETVPTSSGKQNILPDSAHGLPTWKMVPYLRVWQGMNGNAKGAGDGEGTAAWLRIGAIWVGGERVAWGRGRSEKCAL